MFRQLTSRILFCSTVVLAAWCASGCAVPLGPSYTVEKQRIEVTYSLESPDHVAVRASYQLRNSGTRPLNEISVALPAADVFAAEDARVEWRGKSLPIPAAADANGDFRLPFNARWSREDRGEFVITYNLKIGSSQVAGSTSHATFFLPSSGWYPTLLPAQGTFASGGVPPGKWDLIVSVPEGYRVHASGDELGSEHKHGVHGGLRFQQRPGSYFEPFVVAGPYLEQQMHSASGPVILWSTQPVTAKRASEISERVGSDLNFFRTEFGSEDPKKRPTWVIACPDSSQKFPAKPWLSQTGCLTVPRSAVVSEGFFGADTSKEGMQSIDFQLAATWLHFSAHRGRYSAMFPLSAIEDYAAIALQISQSPASRDAIVHDLLRRVDAISAAEKPLITVDEKDSAEVIERGRLQSELFLVALEDHCGAQNVHRAITRVARDLRGRNWSLPDLRSGVEAECGGPVLEGFFREWMHGQGIPETFRARYH